MLVMEISLDDLGALFQSSHGDEEISIGKKGAIPQRGTTRRWNTARENAFTRKKPQTSKPEVRACIYPLRPCPGGDPCSHRFLTFKKKEVSRTLLEGKNS
jgi:hypothetical protein